MKAVENCAICCEIHRADRALCLDCHGHLAELDPFVFRCLVCKVKHGFQGGFGGSGHYYRAGQLWNTREGTFRNYADRCVLSQHAPFQRWLKLRC